MKKKIQALACAAMLAVGGLNVWTAMGINDAGNELKIDSVEMMADGDGWFYNLFHWSHNDYGPETRDRYEWADEVYTPCVTVSGPGRDKCQSGLHIIELHGGPDDPFEWFDWVNAGKPEYWKGEDVRFYK